MTFQLTENLLHLFDGDLKESLIKCSICTYVLHKLVQYILLSCNFDECLKGYTNSMHCEARQTDQIDY